MQLAPRRFRASCKERLRRRKIAGAANEKVLAHDFTELDRPQDDQSYAQNCGGPKHAR